MNGYTGNIYRMSQSLCQDENEAQASVFDLNFEKAFPGTVKLHSTSDNTSAEDGNQEQLRLVKPLNDTCLGTAFQSVENQFGEFDSRNDWCDQNLETEFIGGLWEIENIEEQLEKFVTEEMTDGVRLLQTSESFGSDESYALKTGCTELDGDDRHCQLTDNANNISTPKSTEAMSSCDSFPERLSENVTDCCSSKSVSFPDVIQNRERSWHQKPAGESLSEQFLTNGLSKNIYAPSSMEEKVKDAQIGMPLGGQSSNGGSISDRSFGQYSLVRNDHSYCDFDAVAVRASGSNTARVLDPVHVSGCDVSSDFALVNEADLMKNRPDHDELFPSVAEMSDSSLAKQHCIENSVDGDQQKESSADPFCGISSPGRPSSEPELNTEMPFQSIGESLVITLTRTSSASRDQLSAVCPNELTVNSNNCCFSSSQVKICEDELQNKIADPSVVGPCFLLQSSDCGTNECTGIDSNGDGVPQQLIEKILIQVATSDGLSADDQLSGCKIDGDIENIKQEKPWSFDEKINPDDVWKDPISNGLKECFCPHGYTSHKAGHYHCQECGISLRYRSSAVRHEVIRHRIKHPNKVIMTCNFCPAIFIHLSDLKRHVQSHSSPDRNTKSKPASSCHEFKKYGSVSPSTKGGRDKVMCTPSPWGKTSRTGSQKRKAEDQSPAVPKKAKPAISPQKKLDYDDSVSFSKEFTLNTLRAGHLTTTSHPAYNGPLLSSLLKPTDTCRFCKRQFSCRLIQHRHYAQVHRLYLGGISIFRCTSCKYRSVSQNDFEKHTVRESHRVAVSTEIEKLSLKETALTDDDDWDNIHQSVIKNDFSRKKCRLPNSNRRMKKPFTQPKSSTIFESARRKVPSNVISANDTKRNYDSRSKDQNSKVKMPKYSVTKRINWFFNAMNNTKSDSCPKNNYSLRSSLNVCVSDHVCTLNCICGSDVEEEIASDIKKQKQTKLKAAGKSSDISSEMSEGEFNPVIVESHSCIPSAWSNASSERKPVDLPSAPKATDPVSKSSKTKFKPVPNSVCNKGIQQSEADRNSSRRVIGSISTSCKSIKFYQDTKESFLTSAMAQTIRPTSTEEINSPRLRSQMPVALKRFSRNKKTDFAAVKGSTNSVVIHVSDDENESSNLSDFTASSSTVGKTDRRQIVSSSSHDLVNPPSVNTSASGAACSVDDVIELDDDSDDDVRSNAIVKIENKSTEKILLKSDRKDVASYDRDAPLSVLSDESLFAELQRRSCARRCHCGVYFLDSDVYNLHCAWHSDGESLSCNFCSVNNKDWYEFYSHILNHSK